MARALSLTVLATSILAATAISTGRADTPPGTLMVLQVNGLGTNTNAASISLLEFNAASLSPSSTPINTINVPSSGALALTIEGTTGQHDGMIRLSGNGQFVTFGGYRANAGTTDPTQALASSVNRVIGKYNLFTNTLDTTQAINDAFNYTSLNAVVTQDGNQYWLGGGLGFSGTPTPISTPTNFDLSGGVRYVANTSATTSLNIGMTQTTTGTLQPDSVRSLFIEGGQLYMTTPSQGSYKVVAPDGKTQERGTYQIGTGTPTGVPTATPAYIPVMNNVNNGTDNGQELGTTPLDTTGKFAPKTDAYFLDLNPAIPGDDTAYGTGGKQEYEKWSKYFDSSLGIYRWHEVKINDLSTITGGTPGGSGDINGVMPVLESNGTTVDIYITTDSRLYHFVDATGYVDPGYPSFAGLPTSTTVISGSFSFVAAPVGTQFRGIALVPEPASLAVLALGGAALLVRRRRSHR